MTAKVRSDYTALKEFTENASHEMQTPLSIVNGKLELILDSNNLTEEQTAMVISSQESIQRLSKMNTSLSLLTKIENQEFENIESVNLSKLLQKFVFDFNELLDLKSIRLSTQLAENTMVKMDSTLAAILFSNLFQNAIRHNHENGTIELNLDQSHFAISNSGEPLSVSPDSLFERFNKNNQSKESLGLGLSIVKKICDASGFKISYIYRLKQHQIEISFLTQKVLSR